MRPFDYERPTGLTRAAEIGRTTSDANMDSSVQYLGGGTTLLDLMRLDVMRPTKLVDITRLDGRQLRRIDVGERGLRVGALVTMAQLANHPDVATDYPVISQSLALAASAQIRNMARLGGNALQKTRCSYFRDPSFAQCNKRTPGSGCSALDGHNRLHAVLGTSASCIASYPGDWAQPMIALEAVVEIFGADGPRTIRFADLHKLPGTTPHIETTLSPGDLITGFVVPPGTWRRSVYVKVRDRQSYAFANASAAVGLRLTGDRVDDVRIGLGGVASIPWRAGQAETYLRGRQLTETSASAAAAVEFADAVKYKYNAFKVQLGQATLVRALMQAQALEIEQ